jgi:hypothetical protein
VDTGLCGFRLCVIGGDVVDGGVDPLTIVVALQVVTGGIAIGVFMLVDEFGFQRAEEALLWWSTRSKCPVAPGC